MIAIVDYGVGNLFSLQSSLRAIGAESVVTGDADMLARADRIILPGVGAFADAAAKLRGTGLDRVLVELAGRGTPLLGICLGMQLLFDVSMEYGRHAGLGLIPGRVIPISDVIPAGLKIPHMGWNALELSAPVHPLFRSIRSGECVYFVHSFFAECGAEYVTATAEYGAPLTAAAANGNVMGCQFHPEKSGDAGLQILRSFCRMEAATIC